MKKFLPYLCTLFCSIMIHAQSADDYFVDSAHKYVNSKSNEALDILKKGLQQYPDHPKLKALKEKIEEQQDQNKSDSKQDGEDSKDGSQQEQDKTQNQQQSDQQDGQNQGEKGSGNSDEQSRRQEGGNKEEGNPNNGKDLQEQRYNQILKALKNQEQNTQRRLMMGDNKAKLGRKQKDW